MSAIRSYALEKRFRRTPVLEGLDLDVPSGSIYGLVGPNGAGKTTTIKIAVNILQPSAGRRKFWGPTRAALLRAILRRSAAIRCGSSPRVPALSSSANRSPGSPAPSSSGTYALRTTSGETNRAEPRLY